MTELGRKWKLVNLLGFLGVINHTVKTERNLTLWRHHRGE